MVKKLGLPLCLMLSTAYSINAQNMCGTDDVHRQLKIAHPEIEVYEQQLNKAVSAGLKNLDLNKFARTTGAVDTTTYDIPIVIHVVHDYGNEYLKDDDIYKAVKDWADVYMGRNADTADVIAPFKPYIGNSRIRLHLATKDPNGNPTKGVTHERSYLATNAGDQAKLNPWPQDQYLNIWFINTFSGDHSGAAAYAYYPSSGASIPYYDGVIGIYSYLNYDKAIPHEIGHSLNLAHVWGSTNQPEVACGDDGVDDTPPTKGHMPSSCSNMADIYDTDCAVGYMKTVNGVVIDYPDTVNAQNIMDYTYCQKMFTIGQTDRMRSALTSTVAGRNNLTSPTNLANTGALAPMPDLAPIADFAVEKAAATSGVQITTEPTSFLGMNSNTFFVLKNRSWNDTVSSVSWNYSSTPVQSNYSSNDKQFVTFTQPGWVSVSLTANSNAGSNTLTRAKAIYLADSNAIQPWGYEQTFSSETAMSNWPMFNYYENNFKWEWFSGAGYNDNSCIRFRSYDYRTGTNRMSGTPSGDKDDIFTPAFNLSGFGSGALNLNFYTAGAYSSANSDSLVIYASTNGGRTWTQISTITGSNLTNNNKVTSEFTPSASNQWKAQTINVPTASRTDKVFFKFRYLPKAGGNNLYLDKFTLTPFTTEVAEIANKPTEVKVYPNPTKGACTIAFTTGNDGNVTYTVRDLAGKVIYQQNATYATNTLVEHVLPANIFPAAGFYMVTLTNANHTTTQKVVVQ